MQGPIYTIENYYPQLQEVEGAHANICADVLDLFANLDKDWEHLSIGQLNNLHVFPVYFFGAWNSVAKQKLSRSFAFLEAFIQRHAWIVTLQISYLAPGTHLQPHQGGSEIANHVLRCHYGLVIPEKCGLVCDNNVCLHEDKKWIAFDDALSHAAFNFSTQHRFVLLIDVLRPSCLPKGESKVSYWKNLKNHLKCFYTADDVDRIVRNIETRKWRS